MRLKALMEMPISPRHYSIQSKKILLQLDMTLLINGNDLEENSIHQLSEKNG